MRHDTRAKVDPDTLWVNQFADILPTAVDYGVADAVGKFQPVFSP
jgi:hypothetical protein